MTGIILYDSNRTNIDTILIMEKGIMESILSIIILIFLFRNISD